jgi:sulfate adenylyltransferase subunit 1 (EFTu-like GTPase family)
MAVSTIQNASLASGVPGYANLPTGSVLQVVNSTATSGSASTTSGTFVATGRSLSITPTSASSKIAVCFNFNAQVTTSAQCQAFYTILRESTNILNSDGNLVYNNNATNIHVPVTLFVVDSPSTTSSVTYSLQHRAASSSTSIIDADLGAFTITLMEIAG